MPHTPWSTRFALVLCAGLLSCSGGGDSPTDPGGGEDRPVTRTIDVDGGTISATAQGAKVTLTFPAGAVRGPVEITLRPVEPTAGSRFGMQLEPLGRIFDAEVQIEVALAGSADFDDLLLFLGDGANPMYFPTDVDLPARTIRSSLRFFGFQSRFGVSKTAGINQLGATAVDCATLVQTLKDRFDFYVSAGDFEEAVLLAKTIAATLNKSPCWPLVEDWVQVAESTACDGLDHALDVALATPTDSYGVFITVMEPIVGFMGILQEFSFDSDCAALLDAWDVVDSEIGEYLVFFDGRAAAITGGDWGAFLDLRGEAVSTYALKSAAAALGRADMEALIKDEAFVPAVERMRQIAYDLCESDSWHYALSRLTSTAFFANRDIVGSPPAFGAANDGYASFTDEQIWEDLQYCATHVRFVALTAFGGEYKVVEGGGDGAPGLSTSDIYLDTPTRGTLRLAGTIPRFLCWNDIEADHELVLRYNAQDVVVLNRPAGNPDYFETEDWDIPIETISEQTGVTPKGGNSQNFKVMRRRSACNDLVWGPEEFFLFDLTVNWINPNAKTTVEIPTNVAAGDTVDVSVRVAVEDQLGAVGFLDAIDVVVQAAGGTLEELSGLTDAQGYFRTRLAVDAPAPGKSAQIQVDATATLFEGVTASGSATASVGPAGTANILYLSHTGDVRLYGMGTVKRITGEYIDPASPGGWTWSASAHADSSANGQAYSASGGANVNTTLSLSGSELQSFAGSLSTSMQLWTSGTFELNRTPSADAQIELAVQFEVVGGNVPYTLTGTANVTGHYQTWVEISGGPSTIGFNAEYPAPPPSALNQSGFLEPGVYWIQVYGRSFRTCENCSVSGSMSLGWSLSLGSH